MVFVRPYLACSLSAQLQGFFIEWSHTSFLHDGVSCLWHARMAYSFVYIWLHLWYSRPLSLGKTCSEKLGGTKAVFTLDPVPYRILANRTRRVDFASGLHSNYKRMTRRERYAYWILANGTRRFAGIRYGTGPSVNTAYATSKILHNGPFLSPQSPFAQLANIFLPTGSITVIQPLCDLASV